MEEKPPYRIVRPINGVYSRRFNGRPNYRFMPRGVHRDNKNAYNTRGGDGNNNSIRVPSLKRSDRTWRNFYRLFPHLKGKDTYRGSKLRNIDPDE